MARQKEADKVFKRKMTNFQIRSTYIHANQSSIQGVGKNMKSRTSRQNPFSREGNGSLRAMVDKFKTESISHFKNTVGIHPNTFSMEVAKAVETLSASEVFYQSQGVEEILKAVKSFKDVQTDGSVSGANKAKKSMESVASSISGLTQAAQGLKFNIRSKEFEQNIDWKTLKKEVEELTTYLENFNTQNIVDQGFVSLMNGRNDLAARLVIYELMNQSLKNAKVAVDQSSMHITQAADIKINAADDVQDAIDLFKKSLEKEDASGIKKAAEKMDSALENINKNVKGSTVGEIESALAFLLNMDAVSENIMRLARDIVDMKVQEVAHVGTTVKENLTTVIDLRKTDGFSFLEDLEDLLYYELEAMDKTQDFKIKVDYKMADGDVKSTEWGASVKTYNPKNVERGITLASNTSLGRVLALTRDISSQGPSYVSRLLGNTDASYALFNALVGLLAAEDYVPVKQRNGKYELVPQTRSRISQGQELRNAYGHVFDELTALVTYGAFNTPSVQFLIVNGTVIPSHEYLVAVLDKILAAGQGSSTIINFDKKAAAEIIRDFSTGPKTETPKGKNPKKPSYVSYAVPALFRSASIKKALINEKIVARVKVSYLGTKFVNTTGGN